MNRCAMTGLPIRDASDGIYDDGEWISWDWINGQLHQQELRAEYPEADPELAALFEDLVDVAREHHAMTGRYLQIWGELGELYATVKYGLKRHRAMAPGSDGKLGNDFVEVKTISPEKGKDKVAVKRAGNFSKLLVVRISADFEFESRMIDRKALGKGDGKLAKVAWSTLASGSDPASQTSPAANKDDPE
jgi:hypothetical protein